MDLKKIPALVVKAELDGKIKLKWSIRKVFEVRKETCRNRTQVDPAAM